MRTTIDMPDSIMREVKELAAKRGTSIRALIIEALQANLNRKPAAFELRDASFGEGPTVSNQAINQAIDESREKPFQG